MPEFDYTVRQNPRIRSLKDLMGKFEPREMRDLTNRLDVVFRRQRKQTFSTEGTATGEKWPKLSPKYQKWKRKRYPGRKIMVLRGDLKKSLTVATDPKHVKRWRIRPNPVISLGTRDVKAAYHGRGRLHNPNLPVRDTVQTSREQFRELLRVVQRHFRIKAERIQRVLKAAARARAVGGL